MLIAFNLVVFEIRREKASQCHDDREERRKQMYFEMEVGVDSPIGYATVDTRPCDK